MRDEPNVVARGRHPARRADAAGPFGDRVGARRARPSAAAAGARQLRARPRHHRRLRRAAAPHLSRGAGAGDEPRTAGTAGRDRVQGAGAARGGRRLRSRPPRRVARGRAVHAAAPRPPTPTSSPTSATSARWPSCAGGSTACRWPSSWPRRGLVRCRRPRSPHGWATASALLAGSSRVADQRHRSLQGPRRLVVPAARPRRAAAVPAAVGLRRHRSTSTPSSGCAATAQVPPNMVASVLAALVDKSMVQALYGHPHHVPVARDAARVRCGARRRMRLRSSPGVTARGSSRSASGGPWACTAPTSGRWLDALDGLFDDLRLAVRNALDAGDLDTALRIVVAAREHAFRRLRYELIGWAETALADGGRRRPPAGRGSVGHRGLRPVRPRRDRRRHRAGRAGCRAGRSGTAPTRWAWPNGRSATRASSRGDIPRFAGRAPSASSTTAVALRRRRPHRPRLLHALAVRDPHRRGRGRARARRARHRGGGALGNPTARGTGRLRRRASGPRPTEPARARALLQRSEQLARDVGNLWFELFARTETLWLQAIEGDPLGALLGFADVISAWHRAGDWANQWLSLRHVLGICCLLGADELAATIYGALDRAGAVDAFPFQPLRPPTCARQLTELRERLGDQRFTVAEQQGHTASTSVVIDLHRLADQSAVTRLTLPCSRGRWFRGRRSRSPKCRRRIAARVANPRAVRRRTSRCPTC